MVLGCIGRCHCGPQAICSLYDPPRQAYAASLSMELAKGALNKERADRPMVPLLLNLLSKFTYFALAGMLIIAGCGVPIPEDMPLILSGYLCNSRWGPFNGPHAQMAPNIWVMCAVGLVAMLVGDSILYFIGRHGIDSRNIVAGHVRKVLNPKRRKWIEDHFAKYGDATLFIGRFMPGVRAGIFAFCGIAGMSYVRFLVVDGLAGLISIPTLIWLGHWQAHHLHQFLLKVAEFKHWLYAAVSIAAIVAGVVFLIHRRRKAVKPANTIKGTDGGTSGPRQTPQSAKPVPGRYTK
jgi:membrane protein DedA with SNARE-associated domain